MQYKSILFIVLVAIFGKLNAQETEVLYLSGKGYQDTKEWQFKISDGRKSGEWSTINVPSVWEQEGYGTYQYGIRFYGKPFPEGIADEVGEYKYEFEVPKEWRNKEIRIVFDGSMTDTEVRINGRSAGDKHQGAFYRFIYDITDILKYGKKNILEVKVSKESADGSVNLAERRADYWNFGGIFRPVFLEALPPIYIDRTEVGADYLGNFSANVFLGSGVNNTTVEAILTDAAGKKIKTITETVGAGSDKVHLEAMLTDFKTWTAETPNLYYVDFNVYQDKKLVHHVKERFGFRTIEIRESDGIYVNGQRVLMKGINRHSFWPESGRTLNKELNYADVKLIKEMNMNAVRLSHYPPDPDFLNACDELGLYVMDELGGWHGHYDDAIGKKLVKEMVTRDVNHPSIIFWSNGNEGGWNTHLDNQFELWDIQKRPVLHPQQEMSGVESMHYRSYGETMEYQRGRRIFMPTEYLHGLYDGGHGAGFDDYWEIMRKHPRSGGGYLWVYADEGIARTDQNGKIDNQGNYGADGIVGPHHEKEGSFFTVKEVWSPVMLMNETKLPAHFNGEFTIENRYDFTNTNACTFVWELATFEGPDTKTTSHKTIKKGTCASPDIAPHESGILKVNLPADWQKADILYVKAINPKGEELWTWEYTWDTKKQYVEPALKGSLVVKETDKSISVTAAKSVFEFSKETGKLTNVTKSGKTISFTNGPRLILAKRGDRTLDGTVNPDFEKGEDRIYKEIEVIDNTVEVTEALKDLDIKEEANQVTITASYHGALEKVVWIIHSDGLLQLDYRYAYNGVVELAGICFDYPEDKVKAKKWLGDGPYRVWQNRLKGTTLDIWENAYNDPIPGETFTYPEFKGYFNNWKWVNLQTEEGSIYISNGDKDTYLGIYTPRDGRDALLYTIPQTGISVLDVIPAVRNKVNATDLVGPSSQPKWLNGTISHTIYLKF